MNGLFMLGNLMNENFEIDFFPRHHEGKKKIEKKNEKWEKKLIGGSSWNERYTIHKFSKWMHYGDSQDEI